jgi:hypothetical protein
VWLVLGAFGFIDTSESLGVVGVGCPLVVGGSAHLHCSICCAVNALIAAASGQQSGLCSTQRQPVCIIIGGLLLPGCMAALPLS